MLRRRAPLVCNSFALRSHSPLSSFAIRAYASEVAGLYQAIKNAKLDESTGLISLEEGYKWPTSTETGMQLVVRDCYNGMFEKAKSLVKPLGGGGVVFTGNPGIGKSWFLNYALWKLLQEDKTVLVESVSKTRLWLFKEGTVELAKTTADIEALRNSQEDDNKAWYLFDPCGNIPREPEELENLFTIVSASPNPDHYKQFEKRTGNKYYVPCWSWEEIKKFLPHSAKTVAPGLTEERALENFNIFGGIPRYVYKNEAQVKRTKQQLQSAITQLDLPSLKLVENDLEFDKEMQKKLSHKLLQYEVSDTFEPVGVRFASNYVIDEIAKVKAERDFPELVKTIEKLKGTFAGDLFRGLAARLLTKGGRFRVYPLGGSSNENRPPPEWLEIPPRENIRIVSGTSHLKNYREMSSDEFAKGSTNFPVLDALSAEGGFNYTIAKTHGINGRKGKEVLTALGVEKDNPLKMYWVVKDGEGCTFSKQTVKVNDKDKSSKSLTPEEAEIIEFVESRLSQFVLEIPVTPYVQMNKNELIDLCEKKGLSKAGDIPELISRLEGR